MQPWKRRRRYFVRGRLYVPFEGYRQVRRASTSEPDASLIQTRLALALARRRLAGKRCDGPWYRAMRAGIVSAVKGGRVGNSAWGWSMHGKRGGLAMARHELYKLREISPKGARTSVIARERRKAREAFERDRVQGGPGLPPPGRPRSFLES